MGEDYNKNNNNLSNGFRLIPYAHPYIYIYFKLSVKMKAVFIVLFALIAYVNAGCTNAPVGFQVCNSQSGNVPTGYTSLSADQSLVSLFDALVNGDGNDDVQISDECAQAFADFKCSEAYPDCDDDFGVPIGACQSVCEQFRKSCKSDLTEDQLPSCGGFPTFDDGCTNNYDSDISEWYDDISKPINRPGSASTITISATIIAVVAAVLFF